jgi:hypothetical protein
MSLPNDEIDRHVRRVFGLFLKDVATKPQDEACIQAGVELVINLLQNINDIAYCAVSADQRGHNG